MNLQEALLNLHQQRGLSGFMKTGFNKLDDFLDGGFMKKEFIVLGGHTGLGKSYIAGQLMLNIARQGFKCAYFSLEISIGMVVSRMLGALTNIHPTRIRKGLHTQEEMLAIRKAQQDLIALKEHIYLYDDLYSLEEILGQLRKHKFDFVIIDFIQNIISKGSDEYSRLSQASLQIQKAAKENDCCILALSQLSNTVAREGTRSPVVEYKGSGGIATACDLGFFIERLDFVEGMKHQLVKLLLRKNRRGISGYSFTLGFIHPGGEIKEINSKNGGTSTPRNNQIPDFKAKNTGQDFEKISNLEDLEEVDISP